MALNGSREGGEGECDPGVGALTGDPFTMVPLKEQARTVRSSDQKQLRGHDVAGPMRGGGQVVNKCGVSDAAGRGDPLHDRVEGHGPVQHTHGASHAYAALDVSGLREAVFVARLDRAANHHGQLGPQ